MLMAPFGGGRRVQVIGNGCGGGVGVRSRGTTEAGIEGGGGARAAAWAKAMMEVKGTGIQEQWIMTHSHPSSSA